MPYDLRHIGDFIFKQKDKYKDLSDEDKEKFFFIMNRKFARRYPKHAHFFNNKNIDKSSALDIWYNFFIKQKTTDIPGWYWFKLSGKKEKSVIKKEDIEFLVDYYDIKKEDIEFLVKYFPDELSNEVKKFNKFGK
jgi:hypothetical protein